MIFFFYCIHQNFQFIRTEKSNTNTKDRWPFESGLNGHKLDTIIDTGTAVNDIIGNYKFYETQISISPI